MKRYLNNLSLLALALCLSAFFTTCGDDEEPEPSTHTTPTTPSNTIGTLTIDFGDNLSTTVATATAPADIHIRQHSSYQDPNGSTFACDPQASIRLTVQSDTIHTKTLAELVAIDEKSDSDTDGTNPVSKQIRQTFTIGKQNIQMSLTYEIYTYETSTHQQVEMPYVKLNPAQHGSVNKQEAQTRAMGINEAVITGIRLCPLPTTRGSITTEHAYNVNVSFSVMAEAIHADKRQRQKLSFEVEYVGLVEEVTEYPDPATSISYSTNVEGATTSRSPFTMNNDAQEMAITWLQQSKYTWFDTGKMETQMVIREPKAQVRVIYNTTRPDITWDAEQKKNFINLQATPRVDYADDLTASFSDETQIRKGGNTTTRTKDFTVAGQTITIEWQHEVCEELEINGISVQMPYIELEEPQIVNITTSQVNHSWLAQPYEYNEYKALTQLNVRIRQTLISHNADTPRNAIVEYVVPFIVVRVSKLQQVEYRREVKWVDAHDNIMLGHFDRVHRDRTYANGIKLTDTFGTAGRFSLCRADADAWGLLYSYWNDDEWATEDNEVGKLQKHIRNTINYIGLEPFNPSDPAYCYHVGRDSIYVQYAYMGVPDISGLGDMEVEKDNVWDDYPDNLEGYSAESNNSQYGTSLELRLSDVTVIGSYGSTNKHNGWYYLDGGMGGVIKQIMINYDSGKPNVFWGSHQYDNASGTYRIRHELRLPSQVQYLVIDGLLISFADMVGEYEFDDRVEYVPATEERGPAKVLINEGNVNFLGKNFYAAVYDTIYQIKGQGRPYKTKLHRMPAHNASRKASPHKPAPLVRTQRHTSVPHKTKHIIDGCTRAIVISNEGFE